MDARPDTLLVIGVMTLAAMLCRFSGFWAMRFVPMTPRVQSALAAIPLGVMIGIIAPAVLRGGVPESAGLIATIGVIKLTGSDLLAIIAGLATVALLRLAT